MSTFPRILLLLSIFLCFRISIQGNVFKQGFIMEKIGTMIKHTNTLNFVVPLHFDEYEKLLEKIDNKTIVGFTKMRDFMKPQKQFFENENTNKSSIYSMQSYSELAVFLFSESFRNNQTNKKEGRYQLIEKLDNMISQKINVEKAKIIGLLRVTVNKFGKIKNLFNQNKEKRRGLFNIFGEFSKALIGTATMGDIKRLNAKIDNSREVSEKIFKINNKLVTIVSLQNFQIGNLTEHLSVLDETVSTLITDLNQIETKIRLEAFISVRNMIFETIETFANTIKNTFFLVQIKINSLTESLYATLNNKISPNLIDPLEMKHMLISASKEIPENLFPTPLMYENAIFKSYKLLSTDFITYKNSFAVILNVPLINTEAQYDILKIDTLPIPLSSKSKITSELQFPQNKLFITTNDRKQIAITNSDTINKCKVFGKYFLCNANMKLNKNSKILNCINEIENDEQETPNCKKLIRISNTTNKFIYRNFNMWSFYLEKEESVKIKCHSVNKGPSRNTEVKCIKFARLGQFHLEPNCGIEGELFSIPESFEFKSEAKVLDFENSLKNVTKSIYTLETLPWKTVEISKMKMENKHLQELKFELEEISNNADRNAEHGRVKLLLEQINEIENEAEMIANRAPILKDDEIVNICFGIAILTIAIFLGIVSYKLFITRKIIGLISGRIKDLDTVSKKQKTKVADCQEVVLPLIPQTNIPKNN